MTAPLIVLRQSPDWSRITREQYRQQSRAFCLLLDRPADQMNDVVDAWDAQFAVSFFETRQAMKDIAQRSLAAVAGASCVDEASFEPSAGRPVCFVDDDDWFAPVLGEQVGSLSACDGALWTHVALGFGNRLQRFAPAATDWWCFTNNYAVSPAYVGRHGIAAVTQHWIADQTFRTLRLRHVMAPLSVANKHPASVVFLERSLDGPVSGQSLTRAVAAFVDGLARIGETDLEGIEWAQPYIEATHRHFTCVLTSAR